VSSRVLVSAFPLRLDFDGSRDIFTALPEWEAIKAERLSDVVQQLHELCAGFGAYAWRVI
jgi:hypothetical protein